MLRGLRIGCLGCVDALLYYILLACFTYPTLVGHESF